MSKFQAQKQKIKRQFLHYPRCMKSEREMQRAKQRGSWKSGSTIYSWKNYLNAEVDKYYNVIINRNNNSSTYSEPLMTRNEGTDRSRRVIHSNDNSYSENITNGDQKQHFQQEKRSLDGHCLPGAQNSKNKYFNQNAFILYSKQQIGTNTTIKTFQKHRHSTSVITSQIQKQRMNSVDGADYRNAEQLSKKRQKSIVSLQIERQASKGLKEQYNRIDKGRLNLSKEVSLQIRNLQKGKYEDGPASKMEDKNISPNNYHLQLKLQQREYLLGRFMEHYEHIHHQIL